MLFNFCLWWKRPALRPDEAHRIIGRWGAGELAYPRRTPRAARFVIGEAKRRHGAEWRICHHRRVVEQLHKVDAGASEAEAALNELLDDEASKVRILDYLRKWRGNKLEEMPANRVWRLVFSHG